VAYRAEISRSSPTVILIVIDQSTSMGHQLEAGLTKAAFLADVLNKTIYTVITNCSKADGVRDYFHLGVVAYAGAGARNGFRGALDAHILHPISRIAEMPLRIETRTKKVVGINDDIVERPIKFPVWFEPHNRGKTSMCAGLTTALDILSEWCSSHPSSFPPTLLHVTDGHPTDGDPEPIADKIKALSTEDGACLLLNLHIDVGRGPPLIFPNDDRAIADRYGKRLFRMSSLLSPCATEAAKGKGYDVRPGARGFAFNAGIEVISDFFDIGTRPSLTVGAPIANR
jgi:hypothetical protein